MKGLACQARTEGEIRKMVTMDVEIKARQLVAQRRESGVRRAIVDSLLMGERNLLRLWRLPAVFASVVIFPVVFLSGFLLTFERFMAVQGVNYVQYLLPIITLQAMFFTAIGSAVTLAMDMKTGMLQRCRAMPISRMAVLGGMLIAYLVRALIATVLLLAFAHVFGFRIQTGVWSVLGFIALTLLFTTTAIMGYAVLALSLRRLDLVQSFTIVPYAPFLLMSTGFSPAENFPGWLQPIVRVQPVSYTADALRVLLNGGELLAPLLGSVIWLIGLLLLFGFIAIRLYRQVTP